MAFLRNIKHGLAEIDPDPIRGFKVGQQITDTASEIKHP
jgi:hypothetical protein